MCVCACVSVCLCVSLCVCVCLPVVAVPFDWCFGQVFLRLFSMLPYQVASRSSVVLGRPLQGDPYKTYFRLSLNGTLIQRVYITMVRQLSQLTITKTTQLLLDG